MIKIGKPMRNENGIYSEIEFSNKKCKLYFNTQPEYTSYLVDELADAFVVILLPYAMTNSEDIYSEAPVSKRLLFQVNDYLIPNLDKATDRYHSIKINAPLGDNIKNIGIKRGIGVGYSGGVDSMYSILTNRDSITHLAVFNVGSFEGENYRKLYYKAMEQMRDISTELGYSYVGIDCNITEIIDEFFLSVNSFRLIACALALGKLWHRYLLSSCVDYSKFHVNENFSQCYDLLLTECLSTNYLRFYSEGGTVNRVEKIKALSDAPEILKKHLHVCVKNPLPGEKNCGLCTKCIHTEAFIESMGKEKNFSKIFPWEIYNYHHDEIIAKLAFSDNHTMKEAYKSLKAEMSSTIKQKIKGLEVVEKVIEKNKKLLKNKSFEKIERDVKNKYGW